MAYFNQADVPKEVVEMKKAFCLIIVSAFILSTIPAYAAELPKPVDKIVKGAVEVIKSPLALFEEPKAEMDSHDNKLVGLFKGILLSPFHMVKRAGHGILDIVTFPID